ncbi:MAG: nicotinamide-nucleotide adenylyltransferase [Thermoplasmatota archaeon]
MRALLMGRYQPFHLGHLAAVRHIQNEGQDPIIAIGSAQISHTLENPFTAGERWEMIHGALAAAGLRDGVEIIPVPDVNRNAIWVRHVETLLPPFTTVYTNNPLPSVLFAEADYDVRPIPFVEREKFEATRIRSLMAAGGDWEAVVPKATAQIIHDIRGVERIRLLANQADKAGALSPKGPVATKRDVGANRDVGAKRDVGA